MSAVAPMEAGPPAGPDGQPWRLRMRDLCERTGLSRQVVHYYIREGLLPPGHKATRNSAWYGDAHVERLLLIRRLQTERFLPLRAIRAVLDEDSGPFTRAQRDWIRELKASVATSVARGSDAQERVEVAPLLKEHGVTVDELSRLSELGLVPVVSEGRQDFVAAEDAWILAFVGELRGMGFTAARGFLVEDLAVYEEAISRLFDAETTLLASRISRLAVAEAGPMLERLLPLINLFLTRYHDAKVRRFFASMT